VVYSLRRGAEQHELVSLMDMFNPLRLRAGPAHPAPSLTRAPDRIDVRGWVSRGASARLGQRIHALFRTESQSFLRLKAALFESQ
jgi:hypothetical protein